MEINYKKSLLYFLADEICFNTELSNVIKYGDTNVPLIIYHCAKLLEASEKFMKTTALYRGSGNYATIQNLRYKINANDYGCLDKQEDPHVLTSLIKLFLRELKQPLITLEQLYNPKIDIKTIGKL